MGKTITPSNISLHLQIIQVLPLQPLELAMVKKHYLLLNAILSRNSSLFGK